MQSPFFGGFADFALAFPKPQVSIGPFPALEMGRRNKGGISMEVYTQMKHVRIAAVVSRSLPFGGLPVRGSRSKPWRRAANECRGPRSNRSATGRRVPELR